MALAARRREARGSRANPKRKLETLPPALAEARVAMHGRRRFARDEFGACRAPRVEYIWLAPRGEPFKRKPQAQT